MGYYSDTALALSKASVHKLHTTLASVTIPEETRHAVQQLLLHANTHVVDDETGAEAWFWSWNKWYSHFAEVAFIEALIDELDPRSYYLLRLGENYDDTVVQGAFWENPFDLCIHREISLRA